jgi:YHS domain-containing protein
MIRKLAMASAAIGLVVSVALSSVAAQSAAPMASKPGEPELGGYCPVAYVAMNQAVRGDPAQKSVHQGKTYLFANADAKMMFDKEPAKYLPAYNGVCATAVAQGMKLASDPKLFTIHNGRAYLFSNAEAKAMFDKDKQGTIAKADRAWATLASK